MHSKIGKVIPDELRDTAMRIFKNAVKDVKVIRYMSSLGYPYKTIAKMFECSITTIHNAVYGKWVAEKLPKHYIKPNLK